MKIVIVGDGKIGSTLAEQLSREGHEITIIDRSGEPLQQTSEDLDILCIEGNGATYATQMEAGVDAADLLIAVTMSDELNLLCCLVAKKIGARHTIARVRNPEYSGELSLISEDLGLSLSVNPELLCATEIARTLRIPSAIKTDTFANGHVELLKVQIPPDSILAGKTLMEMPGLVKSKILVCAVERGENRFELKACEKAIRAQFGEEHFASLPRNNPAASLALGALLSYLHETQKTDLSYIKDLEYYEQGRFMELDLSARRNLELTETIRAKEKRGSLLWVLDKTKTPMGGRLLRTWVERPLLSPVQIRRRLGAVEELVSESVLRSELICCLREIGDMQRLVSRAVYGSANGRDLHALALCCAQLPQLTALLQNVHSAALRDIAQMDTLADLCARIDRAICDEPPFSVREGGILRPGYSEEVDRLRNVRDHGAQTVAELEQRERERTGAKKLKVGYNKVFGYYIDIPNSAGITELPEDYIRKQTLVSSERYFTHELKELENTLLTARERIAELEYQLFSEVRQLVANEVARVQAAADAVARLDALCSLAETAVKNNYVCPEVDLSRTLDIREGRHPVVEQAQKDSLFVPNDTFLNDADDRVAIVTGPNMAGKSTYMRQTALIVLMAQMGSFVPAKSAVIGVVDRVFTRIGASDDLAAGQSTFMVEMSEMANILRHATAQSLLILDEIGRGTSTYDGMAIARAVLEYCADPRRLGAKTMFATHYHELTALEQTLPGVRNYNITAKKQGGTLLFLRKIVAGAADDSYGIEVAKLAGVPDAIITKAKTYLRELESGAAQPAAPAHAAQDDAQMTLGDAAGDVIAEQLRAIDLNTITPLEAMRLLFELQQKARG